MKLFKIRLNLFNNTNVTTDTGMSAEMKTYYYKELIENAEPELVHDQFGQKRPIPKNSGKVAEFRKYAPLVKLTTPLTEGVTPNGQKLSVSTIPVALNQYGGYVEFSDILLATTIDNNLTEGAQLLGQQAGRTSDTITREIINQGTNVLYAGGRAARASVTQSDVLTVNDVRKAVRALKIQNAKKIDGYYIGIIHPDCEYDLMNDPLWQYPHQYVDTENIYDGEIGRIAGVRFVETTEAKIFPAAGASSANVYSTLIIGANAYGVTEIEGMGLQMIIKNLGAGEDPLNQRSTEGWKLTKGATILVQEYMVRVESASSFTTTNDNVNN